MERYAAIMSLLMIVIATFLVEVRSHETMNVATDTKNANIARGAGHTLSGDPLPLINMEYYNFGHSHGSDDELLDMNWDNHMHDHHDNFVHTEQKSLMDEDMNKHVSEVNHDNTEDNSHTQLDVNHDYYNFGHNHGSHDKLLEMNWDHHIHDHHDIAHNEQKSLLDEGMNKQVSEVNHDNAHTQWKANNDNENDLMDMDFDKHSQQHHSQHDFNHIDTEEYGLNSDSTYNMKYNELKNSHGNNKGDIMNRYPKMKNNNGIIYGPEAGNGIAYVPEVYVDERKGLTTSFGVPPMGSQNRGYAVTKDPALKFRKYSKYGTQNSYYQQMRM